MSTEEKTTPSPTKSAGSPQNTIRVIKTNDADATVVEVKVAGEDGAKVTVFGGDIPVLNGTANKTDEKQPDSIKTIESPKEDKKSEEVLESKAEKAVSKNEKIKENDRGAADDDSESLHPLTQEEIDKIVSKHAHKFKKEDLEKNLKFFWSVDEYRFGVFTYFQLMYRIGKIDRYITDKEVAKMFVDLDHDNDNLVSLDEFLDEMSREKPKPKTAEEWEATFKRCDKNKDGYVCKEDVDAVLRENNIICSETEILVFLFKNHAGKDMKLDFIEFQQALTRK